MALPSDRQPYRTAVSILAFAVMTVAFAVLTLGWMLDIAEVRSIFPGAVGMKALTAIGLTAAGLALALLLAPDGPRSRRTFGLVLAAVPGLLGLAVLCEYVFGVRLGIDELPFTDHAGRAGGFAYPGRFAPTTGVCFVLVTGALLTLDRGTRWRWRPAELLAIPMGTVASLSLIGYAYSIPAFYGPASAAKMAVNTALCFLMLAVAIPIARPRGRFLELATTTDPGGVMVRRLVPLCVIVPLALGWLHLRTVDWGLFNDETGTWWLAATMVAGLVAMMWWCAGSLSSSDRTRRALEAQLQDLASHDSLTGLFNRHRFEEELSAFLARSRRYGDTGSLLLLDLDRLKPVNDSLGHVTGDGVLRAVGAILTAQVRESDIVGRLGGDEFAVLLLDATPAQSVARAGSLCAAIADIRVPAPEGHGWTTASIGIAAVDAIHGLGTADVIGRADAAMYHAKRAGGNQLALAQDALIKT